MDGAVFGDPIKIRKMSIWTGVQETPEVDIPHPDQETPEVDIPHPDQETPEVPPTKKGDTATGGISCIF